MLKNSIFMWWKFVDAKEGIWLKKKKCTVTDIMWSQWLKIKYICNVYLIHFKKENSKNFHIFVWNICRYIFLSSFVSW